MSGLDESRWSSETTWTTLQIAPFPASLRRRFKAACVMRGLKLYEGAIEAIEAWVGKEEK